MVVAAALLIAFVIEFVVRWHTQHALESATRAAASQEPTVDVVAVHDQTHTGHLSLPGETAAWYQSTLYARVDGCVGKWFVDIGNRVKAGQMLAMTDTPELDAQLIAEQSRDETRPRA